MISKGDWEEVLSEEEIFKFSKEVEEFHQAFPFLGPLTSHPSIAKYFGHHSDMMLFIIHLHDPELFVTFKTESIILILLQNTRVSYVLFALFYLFFPIWLSFHFCLFLDRKLLTDQ